MKIESVEIENFRSFKKETVFFNDYTCLVGPNGAGKSGILAALNVFFRTTETLPNESGALDEEDFHCKNTKDPIRIRITFTDLSDEAKDDLSHYVRQEKLIITAEAAFNKTAGNAPVRQYGERLGMEDFRPFFEAHDGNVAVAELKNIYSGLRKTYADLPDVSVKAAMMNALHEYESARPDECVSIPSEDQFYGFSKGANRLAKHIQWVYVPAVKDAMSEQSDVRNSALSKLLDRTVRTRVNFDDDMNALRDSARQKYQQILEDNQDALDQLSTSLSERVTEWAHPDAGVHLQWMQDQDKSIRVDGPVAHIRASENGFKGVLGRFGHGLQRSYLLALLQELAGTDEGEPTLVLACEEPELYQHPPQARHLADVLNSLSQNNAQIIVSTHSPTFVSGEAFEDVRMIRKDAADRCSTVCSASYQQITDEVAEVTSEKPSKPEGTLARIHQILKSSLNEMFFTHRLILVEGLEDTAYLMTYLELLGKLDEYRRLGCHIVHTNGKSNMIQPLAIAVRLNIPVYVIFDSDADETCPKKRAQHEKDNVALLKLIGKTKVDSMPTHTVSDRGLTMWRSNIGDVVESDIGKNDLKKCRDKASQKYGFEGKLGKNSLHIGASLAFAWKAGKRSKSLDDVCTAILDSNGYIPP